MGRKLVLLPFVAITVFLTFPREIAAEVLSVTAIVPVSNIWAEAITNNSQISLRFDTKEQKFYYTVWLRGLDYETLKNHTVKMEVFLDETLISTIIQTSDYPAFPFSYEKTGQYRLIFTDITWDRQIRLKEIVPDQPRMKTLKAFITLFL